jgi:hypothetical protein
LTELEEFLKGCSNIVQSRFAKLLDTYPERLTAVIPANGASTKY